MPRLYGERERFSSAGRHVYLVNGKGLAQHADMSARQAARLINRLLNGGDGGDVVQMLCKQGLLLLHIMLCLPLPCALVPPFIQQYTRKNARVSKEARRHCA